MRSVTSKPLYEIKANLFRTMAHPARLAALEVMAADPEYTAPVTTLLEVTGANPSALSQHLAVLKRAGIVESSRSGNAVAYKLTEPLIAELLVVARAFLVTQLAGRHLDDKTLEALHRLPAVPGADSQTVLNRVLAEADQIIAANPDPHH